MLRGCSALFLLNNVLATAFKPRLFNSWVNGSRLARELSVCSVLANTKKGSNRAALVASIKCIAKVNCKTGAKLKLSAVKNGNSNKTPCISITSACSNRQSNSIRCCNFAIKRVLKTIYEAYKNNPATVKLTNICSTAVL